MSSIQNIQDSIKELSVEELLTIIAAATAEAKKKAKIVVKAPKEAKEKKGSMPKGQLPPQLHKPFAWVDFTLELANKNGWTVYTVKGQEAPMEASVERDGAHVFPSTGKPMNRKQAMSLSKFYKENGDELYSNFEAQYVAPEPKEASVEVAAVAAPQPKKEKAAPKPKKTEAEKEAEKEAKLAVKEAEKLAKLAAKEAEKAAKKVAPKKADEKPEEKKEEEVVGLEVPKKKKKSSSEVVDTWEPKTKDGKVYPRTIGGVVYMCNHINQLWVKDSDGSVGDWAGIYLPTENRIDSSAADPFGDDE